MDDPERNQSTSSSWRHSVRAYSSVLRNMLLILVHHSSDFENKFVCGEIMSYDDLKENGSEAAVKAAGKLRQQGKPYESESARTLSQMYLSDIVALQWLTVTLLTGRRVVRVYIARLLVKFVFVLLMNLNLRRTRDGSFSNGFPAQ